MSTSSGAALEERELRCVLSVAEAGSLRGAARALGIAPSAVQRTIAGAERRLGGLLFERGAVGARVTALGRVVVRHGHERRDLEAVFAAEIARARTDAVGEARLAVGLGFLEDIGGRVLGDFQQGHPEVELTVRTGGTDSMVAALLSDTADVAIALHPPTHPDVSVVRELAQPVGLACASGHPLAEEAEASRILRPAALADLPFAVMLPGFGLRALHDEFLRVHGVRVRHVLETDSQAVLIGAVARGRAVSLVPPVFLSPAPPGVELVLREVADEHLRAVRAAVMVRRGRRLPPAARALLETCLAWAESSSL